MLAQFIANWANVKVRIKPLGPIDASLEIDHQLAQELLGNN